MRGSAEKKDLKGRPLKKRKFSIVSTLNHTEKFFLIVYMLVFRVQSRRREIFVFCPYYSALICIKEVLKCLKNASHHENWNSYESNLHLFNYFDQIFAMVLNARN